MEDAILNLNAPEQNEPSGKMSGEEDMNNSDDESRSMQSYNPIYIGQSGILQLQEGSKSKLRSNLVQSVKTMSTKKLINLIKSHPPLWDRNSKEYKDKSMRDLAWTQIMAELFPSHDSFTKSQTMEAVHMLTHRWYNVRDAYVKCRKKKTFNKPKRPYIYSDLLTFLDPIYKLPPKENSDAEYCDLEFLTEDKNETQYEPNDDEVAVEDQVINEEYLDTYLDESEATPAKMSKNDPLDESVISVLANLLEKEEDEDRAFFKSIIPSVKALNRESKIEFRIQVLKLLKNLNSSQKRKRVKIELVNNDNDSD